MLTRQLETDSNINIQMNYWSAEMSNLDVMKPLFTYFEVLCFTFLLLLKSLILDQYELTVCLLL